MLMPSIFGEDLFNDDFMNGFKFPDVDKEIGRASCRERV